MKPVLVWFKRDLRVDDHEALTYALLEGPVLPVYVVEPGYWANDYTSGRQWQFVRESIAALDAELTGLGQPLWTAVGDMVEVLERLHSRFGFQVMHSHQETGPDWTFQRDRAVKAWCASRDIQWIEHKQHGVIRGLSDRARWSRQWGAVMDAPRLARPAALPLVARPPKPAVDVVAHVSIADERLVGSQPGGSIEAEALLNSFLETRGERYRGGMSSPNTAETVCSRLSPHFALGTISVRTVWQESQAQRARFQSEKSAEAKRWSAS
jgi:Deoxyribodipyrimidine photolyase